MGNVYDFAAKKSEVLFTDLPAILKSYIDLMMMVMSGPADK